MGLTYSKAVYPKSRMASDWIIVALDTLEDRKSWVPAGSGFFNYTTIWIPLQFLVWYTIASQGAINIEENLLWAKPECPVKCIILPKSVKCRKRVPSKFFSSVWK